MTEPILITSRQNPKIKTLLALRKRREREAAGITLLEGYAELSLAIRAGLPVSQLYFCPELMGDVGQQALLARLIGEVESVQLTRDVFAKVAYRESPDGWLAVVPAIRADLHSLTFKRPNPLVLVCEAVEKPGNLGAILRTADAVDADAVIATERATDWGNPNIVRASKGTVFAVPVADTTNIELLAWLGRHNFEILAATPDTDISFTDVDMTKPTAILVGTEHDGLSDFWLQHATAKVRIPMFGVVDSLNVATSAALLAYEAQRQRLAIGSDDPKVVS